MRQAFHFVHHRNGPRSRRNTQTFCRVVNSFSYGNTIGHQRRLKRRALIEMDAGGLLFALVLCFPRRKWGLADQRLPLKWMFVFFADINYVSCQIGEHSINYLSRIGAFRDICESMFLVLEVVWRYSVGLLFLISHVGYFINKTAAYQSHPMQQRWMTPVQ